MGARAIPTQLNTQTPAAVSQSAVSERPAKERPIIRGDNNWIRPAPGGSRAIITQDLNSGVTPADMVTALLGPGVAVSNVTYSGANAAAGTFSGAAGIVGFDGGIILGSGAIAFVPGPNTQDDVSGVNSGIGDADLDGLIPGYTSFDACTLEFDFQCTGTQVIQFRYVFSSEEYNEWVDSPFNDVFGFFLNGVNIALVPGSPGTPVSINNVNCSNPYNPPVGSYCNLFINNDCNDIPPGAFPCPGVADIQMDGMTIILTATGVLSPGLNHIKLAVADAGDQVLDSNVFIQGQSFACGEPTGACCDTVANTCVSNVLRTNCQGPGMVWTVGLACNQLDPPCTEVIHPPGTDCVNPIQINSLPFSDTNTTGDKGNDYTNTCLSEYDNGLDIVYELTISATQCVDISVTGATASDNWIGVALDSACPPGAACLAQGTSQGNVATITGLTLAAGHYYIMIDRWPLASESLSFTLNVTTCGGAPTGACCNSGTQVCVSGVLEANCLGVDDTWTEGVACGDLNPPCAAEVDVDGKDCEFPIVVPAIPFDDVNSTAVMQEDYSSTCLGAYDDGDDIIYKLVLTSARCVNVVVAGATPDDHSIGVVLDDVCPPGLSCLAHVSTDGTVAALSDLALSAGTYYLMIDRRPDDLVGATLNFRLTISECPAASGACCLPDGGCAQLVETDCANANGLTWTVDSPCSPNPCVAGWGDMNCDGFVTVGDIRGFVLALTDPVAYAMEYPKCDIQRADVNQDGFVTVGDISAFVTLLVGAN